MNQQLKELIETKAREISGYEGKYFIDSAGVAYSSAHRELRKLKPYCTSKGYMQIDLWCNNKRNTATIHRLVASAFIPNPHDYPQVNHKDGNKQNNNVYNLEWCNQSQNQIHACEIGLVTHLKNKRTHKRIGK